MGWNLMVVKAVYAFCRRIIKPYSTRFPYKFVRDVSDEIRVYTDFYVRAHHQFKQ